MQFAFCALNAIKANLRGVYLHLNENSFEIKLNPGLELCQILPGLLYRRTAVVSVFFCNTYIEL